MDSFVTIMTFTHPSELLVLRARLESDGIECIVLNELTTQVIPFYSNAIGGVKLQVKESDVPKTLEILKESGYLKESETKPSRLISQFNQVTSRVPILRHLRPELRIIYTSAILILLIATIIYWVTLPSLYERLTKNGWCIEKVTYNGKTFMTSTIDPMQIWGLGFCKERLELGGNGTILLPGINTEVVIGKWILNNDKVQIMQVDTYEYIFNGLYEIDISENKLILKSNRTTLYCHPENLKMNFPL